MERRGVLLCRWHLRRPAVSLALEARPLEWLACTCDLLHSNTLTLTLSLSHTHTHFTHTHTHKHTNTHTHRLVERFLMDGYEPRQDSTYALTLYRHHAVIDGKEVSVPFTSS